MRDREWTGFVEKPVSHHRMLVPSFEPVEHAVVLWELVGHLGPMRIPITRHGFDGVREFDPLGRVTCASTR
jgi:hypothetical protein